MSDLILFFTGLPASGKTTLAREVASRLNLDVIDKDDILEGLFESVGCNSFAERKQLSRASDRMLKETVLESHGAAVVSFWRGPSASEDSGTPTAWISELSGNVVEIFCDCPPEVALERFVRRKRHPSHFDSERNLDDLHRSFHALSKDGPLKLGQLIRVDTAAQIDRVGLVRRIQAIA